MLSVAVDKYSLQYGLYQEDEVAHLRIVVGQD